MTTALTPNPTEHATAIADAVEETMIVALDALRHVLKNGTEREQLNAAVTAISLYIGSTTLNKWLAAHGYHNRTFYRVTGYGTGFLLSPNNARS